MRGEKKEAFQLNQTRTHYVVCKSKRGVGGLEERRGEERGVEKSKREIEREGIETLFTTLCWRMQGQEHSV